MAKLTVGPVRLSYAYIFSPRPSQTPGATAKYGAQLLIPKSSTAMVEKIKASLEQTKREYLEKNPKATWIKNAKTTLYDGDGPRPGGDDYGPECKGHWVLSTSSQRQPQIVDRDKQAILDDTQVYSGCYAIAVVGFYCYDTNGNKGVACGLNGVMKWADGDPLGGARVTDSDWDNVSKADVDAFNDLI